MRSIDSSGPFKSLPLFWFALNERIISFLFHGHLVSRYQIDPCVAREGSRSQQLYTLVKLSEATVLRNVIQRCAFVPQLTLSVSNWKSLVTQEIQFHSDHL